MNDLNAPTFSIAKLKAKLVSHIVRLVRGYRLDYPTLEAAPGGAYIAF